MKHFFAIIFLALSFQICHAQNYLLPFKQGNLYGLQDQNGKMVVEPKYSYLEWLTDKYFETTKRVKINDTVEIEPSRFYVRNDEIKLSGIIYNGKEILGNEPFEDYYVMPGFIMAKADLRKNQMTKEHIKKYDAQTKFIALFNTAGKNLYPENFRRLTMVDTTGKSTKTPTQPKFVLFASENFMNQKSLFVYDCDKQQIAEWLLKDVSKLDMDREGYFPAKPNYFSFSYVDKNYDHKKAIIEFFTGKFVMKTLPAPENKPEGRRFGSPEVKEVYLDKGGYGGDIVAVPEQPMESKEIRARPPFVPYYNKINDTLFYQSDYEKKEKVDTTSAQFIYQNPSRYLSQSKIIYKKNGKFGLHTLGKMQPAEYDSLVYFGTYFLLGKKNNGKMQFGILDNNDSLKVPIQYDSIQGSIGLMVHSSSSYAEKGYQIIEESQRYSYDRKSANPYAKNLSYPIVVFKDGKGGVLTWEGEMILPMDFEGVWKNGFNFMNPRKSDFYITKKNGKYGAATFNYNPKNPKKYVLNVLLEPAQTSMPLFFLKDYYGIKGLTVFGLYNEKIELVGYEAASR